MANAVLKNIRLICLASASPRRRELVEKFGIPVVCFSVNADENVSVTDPAATVMKVADNKIRAALEVRKPGPGEVILSADTSVWLGGNMLGKPKGAEDARRMLKALSGKTHEVYTAFRLAYRATEGNAAEEAGSACATGAAGEAGSTCAIGGAGEAGSTYSTGVAGESAYAAESGAVIAHKAEAPTSIRITGAAIKTAVHVNELSDAEIDAYVATGDPLDKAGAYGIQGDFGVHIAGIEGDYNNVVGLPVAAIYDALKAVDEDILRCTNAGKKPDEAILSGPHALK